jgi:hypothetical protein
VDADLDILTTALYVRTDDLLEVLPERAPSRLCTLHGLPAGFALAGAKADERQVLLAILDDAGLAASDGVITNGDERLIEGSLRYAPGITKARRFPSPRLASSLHSCNSGQQHWLLFGCAG